MEKENLALTAELIALRGGLSLISKYSDEIKKCQRDDETANWKSNQASGEKWQAIEKREKIELNIEKQEEICERLKGKINEMKKSTPEDISDGRFNDYLLKYDKGPVAPKCYRNAGCASWVYSILVFILFDIILAIGVVSFGKNEGMAPMLAVLVGMASGLFSAGWCCIPIIWLIIVAPIIQRIKLKKHKIDMEDYKLGVIATAEKRLCDEHLTLEQMRKNLEDAIVNEERTILESQIQYEYEVQIRKKNAEEIKIWAAKSAQVNESLRKSYGTMIMECDWQNVDLILHYIETGRADSLKEALQQVDRQRQTDQIEKAIQSAAEAVSAHIESAFSRMGSALSVCFNRLSANIMGISEQLEKNEHIASDANRALLNRLDKQISVSEIQNALLSKANKSSDELLNDLRYNQQFWRK